MIHREHSDRSLRIRHCLIRDDDLTLAAGRFVVELVKVTRLTALFVVRFYNDLILIDRRLNQIGVVLGIRIFQQFLDVDIG